MTSASSSEYSCMLKPGFSRSSRDLACSGVAPSAM
jgi:hypothetical protein